MVHPQLPTKNNFFEIHRVRATNSGTIAANRGELIRSKTTWWHPALIGIAAAVFRLPIWLTTIHQTFDEGVFLASNDLVRAGFTPFGDVFSSQGPLFLPMIRASQWLSFGDPRGGRTLMVVAGLGFSVAFYFIARKYMTDVSALVVSLLVATSGSGVLAAGPIQSDGLALAFSVAALAILLNRTDWWASGAAGVSLGAALAVKSLHVIPIVALIAIVLASRKAWRDLVTTGLTAATTVVLVSIPFGLAAVWNEYVMFHLAKDNTVPLLDNVSEGWRGLWQLDLPVVVIAAIAFIYRLSRGRSRETPGPSHLAPHWLPLLWLLFTLTLLTGFTPIGAGFSRALIFLVPVLLLTFLANNSVPTFALGVLVVGAVVWQATTVGVIRGNDASQQQNEMIEILTHIPDTRPIVSDDPGIVWASGQLSHPETVDPSFARFKTGYLTSEDVELSLLDPATCAYLALTGRFETTTIRVPADYAATSIPGVFVRSGC